MLDRILREIEICLENGCFISALGMALTIPDICGKVEFPDLINQTGKRYVQWYNEYIGQYEKCPKCSESDIDMPYPSGEMIYSLRNSVLHQGTPEIDTNKIHESCCKVERFSLIVYDFMCGGSSTATIVNGNVTYDSIEINIVNLCKKIVLVARKYYQTNKEKFTPFDYSIKDERGQ